MDLWFSCISSFVRSFARLTEFIILLWSFKLMCWFRIFVICFASLYAGAVLLFITGRIGILVLCNFSWALRTGGEGFFCVRNFVSFIYDWIAFCIDLFIFFWNLLVGSLVMVLKLLVVSKDCTLSAYSLESMITTLLLLSAWVTNSLCVCSFLFSSFTIYNCLFGVCYLGTARRRADNISYRTAADSQPPYAVLSFVLKRTICGLLLVRYT